MSLSRTFFNEFRPFFRLFDEVARSTRPSFPGSMMHRHGPAFAPFDDFVPFQSRHPSLDLTEHDNDYIVEAEVPGVKKENLEVRVGDNGRSLTIQGKVLSRSYHNRAGENATAAVESGNGTPANENGTGEAATKTDTSESPTVISSERDFVGSSGSHFTRTVWLPRAVDPSKINASLQDGILTLRVPKLTEDQGSFKVQIQ